MTGLNYTITTPDGPLPLGTPVFVGALGSVGACAVAPDPVNAGRYSLLFPSPGPTTITLIVAGYRPLVWQDTIPPSGPVEASVNNPAVLSPL
jgi:hypothetical protein